MNMNHRWIITIQECETEKDGNGNIKHYIKLVPFAITGIDFGLKCPDSIKKEVQHIITTQKYSHIKLTQATMHLNKYELVYMPISTNIHEAIQSM